MRIAATVIKFRLSDAVKAADTKPKGYLEAIQASATAIDGDKVVMSKESYDRLKRDFPTIGGTPKVTAVPRYQWPMWAQGIALFANIADTGVGDTVARVVGPIGGDKFKMWHKNVFGKDCDCAARQERWNTMYPYREVNNGPQN